MLEYEFRIRHELTQISVYAENIRHKFDSNIESEELCREVNNLESLWITLKSHIPKNVGNASNFDRHLGWMKFNLNKNAPKSCRGDIEDICKFDIPAIEEKFWDWCKNQEHFDSELKFATTNLIVQQELDSAVRKAFVILKTRLVSKFGLSEGLDGVELVNKIYGSQTNLCPTFDNNQRQAMRDLLAGLFGVFRNKYAHHDNEVLWCEVEAILTMINFILKEI